MSTFYKEKKVKLNGRFAQEYGQVDRENMRDFYNYEEAKLSPIFRIVNDFNNLREGKEDITAGRGTGIFLSVANLDR